MRFHHLGLALLACLALIGCGTADAGPDDIGPTLTAGPFGPIDVPAGDIAPVALDLVAEGELDDLLQSDGLISLADGPVLISAHVALAGHGTAAIQTGPRAGPWHTISLSSPPIVPGLVVGGPPDHYVRLAVASTRGARIIGGDPLQTWVTAVRARRQ